MSAKDWLQKAKNEKFAIGAFNVGNLETFKAVIKAAADKKSPIIIESSPGETEWMGADNIVDIARNFTAEFGIPVLVNLDHALTLEECQQGIDSGYDLIHFDGSKLPYEQNVELAKQVVELAHARGLTCEGELDHIGGSSEVHQGSAGEEAAKIAMTEPEKAAQFVKATGVDIFAAFIGNVHGLYLGQQKNLDIDRLKKIAEATGVYLSLHGSSGIPEEQVKEAIQNGIVKVNLNTEIRQSYKDSLEKVLQENPGEYAMYKVEGVVLDEIQRLVEAKIDLFGSGNKL
ncbi:class II fructose-bisphosphate aldolase [Candidatus Daviesbacteria bacterium]|nr:class II fructose-bisphosphate aldolase [Candidatus Daviesbacteria bacterium]